MIPALLLVLLLPLSALAASPDDFAGGYDLEIREGYALQRLELPWEVYDASTRADLGDMRVFNAAGEEVPMLLRRATPEGATSVELPLFRLAATGDGRDFDFRLRVMTSEQGAVVETRVQPSGAERNLLLLDATGAPAGLEALRFDLGGGLDPLRVDVRGSDDLATWRAAGSGVLARMEHPHGRILQDRIPLTGRFWRYYLVSGDRDLSMVASAEGIPRSGHPDRRFAPLTGTLVQDGVWEFALPAGLPADRLDLAGADNAVVGVEVMVPAGDDWRRVASGSLFRLNVDGQSVSGQGIALRGPLATFRVVMQGSPAPLRVGWLPHELVFMPQGAGPFTLALGNPSVPPGPHLLEQILSKGDRTPLPMGQAALGSWKTLGGEDRLRPVRSYTRMLLWAVLGLGAALLGWMAWRLTRTLDE
jgi:hypothetical protein